MRALLALFFLTGCAARGRVPKDFSVSQSYACPYPAQTGLIELKASGEGLWVTFDGLQPGPDSKARREKKTLPPEDVKALWEALDKSAFRDLPERVESFPPKYERSDPCSRSLTVKARGQSKTVSFSDADIPPRLRDVLQPVDEAVHKGQWEPHVYPWEARP